MCRYIFHSTEGTLFYRVYLFVSNDIRKKETIKIHLSNVWKSFIALQGFEKQWNIIEFQQKFQKFWHQRLSCQFYTPHVILYFNPNSTFINFPVSTSQLKTQWWHYSLNFHFTGCNLRFKKNWDCNAYKNKRTFRYANLTYFDTIGEVISQDR